MALAVRPGVPGEVGRRAVLQRPVALPGGRGATDRPASGGGTGRDGQEAKAGTVNRIDLDADRLMQAFGFGADDG